MLLISLILKYAPPSNTYGPQINAAPNSFKI